jgi:hypothetical protein
MADNTLLNSGTGGDSIRDIDKGGVKTQVVVLDTGGTGAESIASATNPYPIGIAATPFQPSASNSSSANLAPGQKFTGGIQANQNQPVISINIICDQPTLIVLYGSADAAGLSQIQPITVPLPVSTANFGVSIALPGNANYYWVTVTNVGTATTTRCVIDVGSGWLFPTTALGNAPTSINEIAGVAITGGSIPINMTNTSALLNSKLDMLGQILTELRVMSTLLTQLGSPIQDDPDKLRSDFTLVS